MNPIDWYKQHGWRVTSAYGPRSGTYAGFHNGTDLGGYACNAPVKTPYGGRVRVATGTGMGTWGKVVVIEIAPGLLQLTSHHNAFHCKVGDIVTRGAVIATNGGTNNTSKPYACHIHYEIRIDNGTRAVGSKPWGDPEKFYLDQEVSNMFKAGDRITSIANSNVNVRANPGTSQAIVAQVVSGETVTVKHADGNGFSVNGYKWWLIDKGGWIAEQFFRLAEESPANDLEQLLWQMKLLLDQYFAGR